MSDILEAINIWSATINEVAMQVGGISIEVTFKWEDFQKIKERSD